MRLQLTQVCQSAPSLLAPWGVALLLHPPLIGQTKIFSVIPETEIIPHLYRRSSDLKSTALLTPTAATKLQDLNFI